MEIDYEVRSEMQLLLALVFVLVVIPCTFKYTVPVFWQLYFSGVEVMVCGLVVDKKESECFVHLPRSMPITSHPFHPLGGVTTLFRQN